MTYKMIPIIKGGVCVGVGMILLLPHKELHVPEPGPQFPISGKPMVVQSTSTAAFAINPTYLPLK